jgi:hypothetical protein
MDSAIDAIILRDTNKLAEIIKSHGENISCCWNIIHYLVHNDWYDGIALYKIYLGCNMNHITTDYCSTTSGIPIYIIGGQNALFMARSNQMVNFLFEMGIEEVIDNNGNTYKEYLSRKNDFSFYRENYLKVKERVKLLNPLRNIIIDNQNITPVNKNEIYSEYTINSCVFEHLNSDEIIDFSHQNVNSMHKKSIKIIITDVIKQLILSVFNDNNINIYSIQNITGFLIEYNEFGEKKLDKHVDDSKYTINICLENTSDCELHFDNWDRPVINVKGNLLCHMGNIPHCVTNLTHGTKKNIILWLS